jgi:hypothetical protein
MKKDIAIQLIEKLFASDKPLNAAAEVIEKIEDEEEKKKFRRGILEIMGRMYTDLELPILRQFPDLDPDKKLH